MQTINQNTKPNTKHHKYKLRIIAIVSVIAMMLSGCSIIKGNKSQQDTDSQGTEIQDTDPNAMTDNSNEQGESNTENTDTQEPQNPYALVSAVYPETIKKPSMIDFEEDADTYYEQMTAWRDEINSKPEISENEMESINSFTTATATAFLTDNNGENRIYSPLNIYMALAMLAETTDGDSREQILSLLNTTDIETLRDYASTLWQSNYTDDDVTTSLLASSIWLRDDLINDSDTYNQDTLERLAQIYYASVFSGDMGTSEYNSALQSWLNEQTGGLLEEQASGVNLDSECIFALATTALFKDSWCEVFNSDLTVPDAFHGIEDDTIVDFMKRSEAKTYYDGKNFGAISLSLNGGGIMWFILPDEGISPELLIADGSAIHFVSNWKEWENTTEALVHMSIPKFDVSSEISLKEGLQNLGISDVFKSTADFEPFTSVDGVYVSQMDHAARVSIDEDGVTAAAFTIEMMTSDMEEVVQKEIDFEVSRPFVFAIQSADGTPMFVGIVNMP